MTDATNLISRLTEYDQALTVHLSVMQDEFRDLERAWAALSDVYEGNAAEQFRTVFLAAAARMRDYEGGTRDLQAILQRQIDHLRDFDRPAEFLA
ncbi:hypothetical protein [Neokomagataea anthophila]|uniref:WXG100 family type VII secretion target n=1 Tax=Neokomagataea anthophila TaxID=2826925 RepID=A0ABS5E9X5_9PROT|nr:hypothetical protein [Neokomagataea anthophila]MBR0560713.1 hypothetical protein [Neokomagataea anthophila]